MKRFPFLLILVMAIAGSAAAQDARKTTGAKNRPIQALLVTGGCCHDYDRQKLILSRGVSARANVVWTIARQGGSTTNAKIPLYQDRDWSKGFDVVVHNECFASVKDKEFVANILRPHREGLPALLIHCAMHCYRTGDDQWFEFVGVQSPGHGPHYSFTVDNMKPAHPIMKGFGPKFVAPKGELYHSIKVFDSATVLGQANRRGDNKPQVCVWTNSYGDGKVFATTIGHYNETMAEPKYLDMITKGLLWACERDTEAGFTPSTKETDEAIRALIAVNLAPAPKAAGGGAKPRVTGKLRKKGNLSMAGKASASSEEKNKNNLTKYGNDGNLGTRWCANGGNPGETWQVDLGAAKHVRSLRIHWEKGGAAYRYQVEASADGKEWKAIVDQSKNKKKAQVTPHKVDSPATRHLRVTFLGSSGSYWGSFWEFEAYASAQLPPLKKAIRKAAPAAAVGSSSIADVKVPDGFKATLFGKPPEVNYPVCIAAAVTGEVFVGVDEQGSLGKKPGGGRVVRCIDTDGDGEADKINVFAKMDHPRGLFYDNGSLWVLHPPLLTVYHDTDLDGVADRHETLITGISSDETKRRGADHTTNGIRMGIDGWLYIAVGDFGFTEAKGKDGTMLARRGGGVVRVRLDGTGMEIFSWGQRNIVDICVDPYLNLYTRDNTNDGGGWDIRLSHVMQSGLYGYPSLYLNFTEETFPPLKDYGGGSGCGAMYFQDLRWPKPYGDALYTCDWGTSTVYRHNLPANGATFDAHQEVFIKLPRPTDMDVDGSGRLYVTSWKNGKFNFSGPNVGFVTQVTPAGFTPKPFKPPHLSSEASLLGYLSSPSAVHRLHSQRELVRRGKSDARVAGLSGLAADAKAPLYGRIAAIYTLKQILGTTSNAILLKLLDDASIREAALRALTDDREGLDKLPLEPFLVALKDENPRVRAQALISLGRLGRREAGKAILPLTIRPSGQPGPEAKPLYKQADPGRVIPHLAVRALESCNSVKVCLEALEGPHAAGAFWALKYMHNEEAVSGLAAGLSRTQSAATRREILTTLVRLYHREGDYKSGWWGTRPDRSGPYYDRKPWAQSEKIAAILKTFLAGADANTLEGTASELARHKVKIAGLPTAATVAARAKEAQAPIVVPQADPNNPNLVANLKAELAASRALKAKGSAKRGEALFKLQTCNSCHTTANGQLPKGPHLVDIGKRYKKAELIESILKPSAKIAQGFDTYVFVMKNGKAMTGFVTSESAEEVELRQINGISSTITKSEVGLRRKSPGSVMPIGLVNSLSPEQLADLIAYLQSLK